jgi:hypothetical protein
MVPGISRPILGFAVPIKDAISKLSGRPPKRTPRGVSGTLRQYILLEKDALQSSISCRVCVRNRKFRTRHPPLPHSLPSQPPNKLLHLNERPRGGMKILCLAATTRVSRRRAFRMQWPPKTDRSYNQGLAKTPSGSCAAVNKAVHSQYLQAPV